jgi:hypothetical protein
MWYWTAIDEVPRLQRLLLDRRRINSEARVANSAKRSRSSR